VSTSPRNKPIWLGLLAALLFTISLAGCARGQAWTPPTISGIVTVTSYGHQFSVGNVWQASLAPDSGDYNGAPNVVLSNDGDDGCIFNQFVHNGDHLTIIASGGSFNSLIPSDVTDNTTGYNLGAYSVPDSC